MEILTSYNLIIEASVIIILSFVFGEVARKTNIPSVLMLIGLGIILKFALDALGVSGTSEKFFPILEILGNCWPDHDRTGGSSGAETGKG